MRWSFGGWNDSRMPDGPFSVDTSVIDSSSIDNHPQAKEAVQKHCSDNSRKIATLRIAALFSNILGQMGISAAAVRHRSA